MSTILVLAKGKSKTEGAESAEAENIMAKKEQKHITVADIMKHSPCYDPLTIPGVTKKTKLTLLQCMKFKGVKDVDKVWLATRFMTDLQNRTFAIWCARSCKTKVKEVGLYIDAIGNYYIKKTITIEQLSAAGSAADRAADSAADWAADRAADSAAYSAADRAKQVKQIIKMLKEAL